MRFEEQDIAAIVDAVIKRLPRATEQEKRWMTITAFAEHVGRSAHAVRHLTRAGELHTAKFGGRIYIDLREFEAKMESIKDRAL